MHLILYYGVFSIVEYFYFLLTFGCGDALGLDVMWSGLQAQCRLTPEAEAKLKDLNSALTADEAALAKVSTQGHDNTVPSFLCPSAPPLQ